MNGTVVFAGQASGKSTLHAGHASSCLDVELLLAFNPTTIEASRDAALGGECDLTRFFMRHVLPLLWWGAGSRRVVMTNLVTPHNLWLVRMLVRGLCECGVNVRVFSFADQCDLEKRVVKRNDSNSMSCALLFEMGGIAHTVMSHALLHGLSLLHDKVRVVHELEALPQPPLFNKRKRFVVWDVGSRRHSLEESVPGQFVETVDGVPVCLYEWDGGIVFACSKSSKTCARQHGFDCSFGLEKTGHKMRVSRKGCSEELCFAVVESSLEQHVPVHKLRMREDNDREQCVLALYGSFAPIHVGHLEMLSVAKSHLEEECNMHVRCLRHSANVRVLLQGSHGRSSPIVVCESSDVRAAARESSLCHGRLRPAALLPRLFAAPLAFPSLAIGGGSGQKCDCGVGQRFRRLLQR